MLHTSKLRALLPIIALLFVFSSGFGAPADPGKAAGDVPALTEIFSKKAPLMGRAPRQISYSPDGTRAAYVHGDDLWLLDTATGEKSIAANQVSLAAERNFDFAAPARFLGVRTYAWSPRGDELLFTSEGLVYRYDIAAKKVARFSATRLAYWSKLSCLPDGSGFVGMGYVNGQGFGIYRGIFAEKTIRRWSPGVGGQVSPVDFQISPDGRQAAVTLRVEAPGQRYSTVEIATFSERLMRVRTVGRMLPTDPAPAGQIRVYLAPITALTQNRPVHANVFTYQFSGPADAVSRIHWALDSQRFALATVAQKAGEVRIYTVRAGDVDTADGMHDVAALHTFGPGELMARIATVIERESSRTREVHQFHFAGAANSQYMTAPWFLADNRTLAFTGSASGFWQVHTVDVETGKSRQITHGDFEIYPVAVSSNRQEVYVAAAKERMSRRDLYRVDLADGRLHRLTPGQGTYGDDFNANSVYNVAIRPDGQQVLAVFAAFGTLKELVAVDVAAGTQKTLTASHGDMAHRVGSARPEFFSYQNRHGDTIHGYLFKPANWQSSDRRPALVYVYGGPLGIEKMVQDGDPLPDHIFAWYMAQKHGYVTVVIDPRGSSGYGGRFEKANFNQPGRAAVEDLQDGVKHLAEHYGVDEKRVALHGWSFGGFVTQMCMYTSDTFAVGIAGAGPTEWENYNAWYTTSVVGEPANLKQFSLLPLARNLKGQLLLVHGMEDDNVLVQDTIHVMSELFKAGKATQVKLLLDPRGRHGLGGDVSLADRYQVYEQFLVERLGQGRQTPGPQGNRLSVRN